jgi:hypothetical protein
VVFPTSCRAVQIANSSITWRVAELFVETIRFDDGREPEVDDATHETSKEVLKNDTSIILEFSRIAFTLV